MIQIEGRPQVPVGTIYCIGRNYLEHARELGNTPPEDEPVVFLKSASSLRGLSPSPIAYRDSELHYEAELVVRIGKIIPLGCLDAGWDAVDAIGLGLDLTHRKKQQDLKRKGLPWTVAKSFLGATILSPMIHTDTLNGRTDFEFMFFLEGNKKQHGYTKDMIYSIPKILSFLASINILHPGDLIFTGTPAGVGPICIGQRFSLQLTDPNRIWDGQF